MSIESGRSSTSQINDSPKQQVEEMANFKRSVLLRWLERMALFVERPFNWPGNAALNIFYHTDTLAVFLWLVVALTGLYLSLFYYQFDFKNAYLTIAIKIQGPVLSRVVRAIHRYASDSALIVTVLHGIRLFFMDRFRGARWLAWVSGVVMILFLWVDGLTGYWLIWDQRSQLITNSFIELLNRVSQAGPAFVSNLLVADKTNQSWVFITVLVAVHVLLFGGVALFFWWHIMRLQRPRFLPARYWVIGAMAVLVIVSAAFPLERLPIADFSQLPRSIPLDPFYFFYLPFSLGQNTAWPWIGLAIIFVGISLIPWMTFKHSPAPILIDRERCGGCTTCAADCPYKAITMLPRAPGETHKLIAKVDGRMCVACGVCLGSCDKGAISMGDLSEAVIWQRVEARLARHPGQPITICFTCERHAAQDARRYLDQQPSNNQAVEIIPLPCVAAVSPSLIARAMSSGAGEVRVVGCPPDDCSRREGNLWTDARLNRTRLPRLKKAYENAPIYTFWLAPDAFAQALPVLPSESTQAEANIESNKPGASYSPILTWRNFALAFGVLAILMAVQVRITQIWSPQIYPMSQAYVQLVVPDPLVFVFPVDRFVQEYGVHPTHLTLRDGEKILLDQPYPFTTGWTNANPIVAEFPVALGGHNLTLSLTSDSANPNTLTLYNRTITLTSGQVWIIMYDSVSLPRLYTFMIHSVSYSRYAAYLPYEDQVKLNR